LNYITGDGKKYTALRCKAKTIIHFDETFMAATPSIAANEIFKIILIIVKIIFGK